MLGRIVDALDGSCQIIVANRQRAATFGSDRITPRMIAGGVRNWMWPSQEPRKGRAASVDDWTRALSAKLFDVTVKELRSSVSLSRLVSNRKSTHRIYMLSPET